MSTVDELIKKYAEEKVKGVVEKAFHQDSMRDSTQNSMVDQLIKKYNGYTYTITEDDAKEVNDFIKEYENFVKSATSDYQSLTYSNAKDVGKAYGITADKLKDKASNFKMRFNLNKATLSDKEAEYAKYFDDIITNIDNVHKGFSDTYSYYKRFETEDDYNAYIDYQDKISFDITAGQAEIDELDSKASELDKQIRSLESAIKYPEMSGMIVTDADHKKLDDLKNQYKTLSNTINTKRAYLDEAKELQGDEKFKNDILNAPDYAEKSQYKSTKLHSPEDLKKYGEEEISSLDIRLQVGYGDLTYEYINGSDDLRGDIESWDRLSNGGVGIYSLDYVSPYVENGYGQLNETEKGIYNYLYATSGKEKAEEYLDSIATTLQLRQANEVAESMDGNVVLQYLFGLEAGIDQFYTGIDNLFSDQDEYNPSTIQMTSSLVREDLADVGGTMPDWLGGGSVGQMGYDATTSVGNMLPSILVSAIPYVGKPLGLALTGMSAAGNAKAEMINLGYDEEQATTYGVLVGASEALLQYAIGGISSLGGKASSKAVGNLVSKFDNALAKTAIKVGGNMVSEGIEEGLQSVLEPAFKALATGEDFESPEWSEVFYSALLGTLTAGAMEGAPTAIRTGLNINNASAMYGSSAQDLVSEALDLNPNSTYAQKMQAKLDKGKKLSGTNLYTLAQINETAMVNKDTTAIQSAVEKRLTELGESGDVKTLAEILTKQAKGEKLTYSEKQTLKNSTYGNRVANELDPKNIESGEYTSAWAKDIGTMRVNKESYNKALEAESTETPSPASQGSTQGAKKEFTSENATSKEIPTEKEFEASESGKTVRVSTGEEVSVKEIASIENGAITLRLDNNETVSADDVAFSESDGLFYENIVDMNLNAATANAFIKGYNPGEGLSAQQYALGFREAYKYGEYGFPMQEMSRDGFSSNLSQSQRQLAYNLGKTDAKYKAAEKQKAIEDSSATRSNKEQVAQQEGVSKKEKTSKGKVHYEGATLMKGLTERQKVSLKGLESLAKALGVDFYIFESEVDENGKRKGANGWFDAKDGSIHIDLYAGERGEGTMLFTAAHELTHFIREWSPAKFKIFADFLLEQYGEKGISVEELVQRQIEKAKNNGRDISYDTAYEEVIADSCEAMLADGDVIAKIAELKAKDKSLWQKIKNFITDLVAKIKAVYEGLNPDSAEGRYVSEMLDTAEKLKSLWTEALVDASDAYTSSNLVEVDTDSQSVAPMFSERTWTASEYVTEREETAKKISKALDVDIQTAYKYIDDINGVARLIADDRARLDYEPNLDDKATVLKPNSEYKYSVDMSTLCAKRLLFTGTFDAIQRALPNTVFDSEDTVALREMMQQRGYEVACGICYVESTRREIGRITQDFIDSYKESQKTGNPITRINSEGKQVELKKTKDQKATTADKSTDKFFAEKDYTPTLADLNTTDIDLVKRDHPLVYEAYLNFMNARGQAKPKLLETRAEYKGEILKHFKAKSAVEARNNAGGLRLQSFSDFEVPHLIDMMQIVMDMSRVGLKSQAYTKVPAFAEVFGDTGVKINLSLIAKGDGLDSKGNLIFDDVEGINHKEAFKLRDKYSKNVGTILVGKTDAHIIAAMADPRIDYIIPFHKSSWKESLYDALGLTGYADYTDFQNEKAIDKDRKIKNFDPSEYWDFTKTGDENAQIYLAKCREDGRIPKFPQFQGYPGYWKLLIDFKMYDNDGVGSPQEVVRPTFNTEASERILSEYKGGHKSFPVAKDVVEDFVKEHKDKVKYSDRDFSSQVDAVLNGSDTSSSHLKLMDTPSLLQEAGLPNLPILMTAKHLKTITSTSGKDKGNYHGLDVEIVKKLPGYISSPVIIADSLTRNDSVVIITEAIDSENRPVIAAVMLNGIGQLDNKYVNANIMTSAYGKDNFQSFLDRIVDSDSVIYWDEKKSQDLSVNLGLQLPNVITSLRSNVIIHQAKAFVNNPNKNNLHSDRSSDSVSNRSLLANALDSVAQNEIERNKLAQYKAKIELIESEQANLTEIRAKIKELSFAKGARDTKAIKSLQFEANQAANRINTYDKQLLNLEASKPLKDVLSREKQMAYKKAEQRGKEALAKYREKAAQTQRELMERNTESRKKAIEGRHKTDMRHKIKDVVNELNQYLLKGTKDKHVPIELQKAVAEALDAVNMDTVGAEERIAKKRAEMMKAKTPEAIEKLAKEIEHIQEMGGNMEAKLSRLKTAYDSIINSDDPLIANSHDEVISNSIANVIAIIGDTPLRDMSLQQLEAVYDLYKMVLASVRNANKAFKAAKGEAISTIANGVIAELDMQKKSLKVVKGTDTLSAFAWNNLKPVYAFERIGSANFNKVFNAVRAGEDTWARDMDEAQAFRKEQFNKYNYKSWDFKKRHSFTATSGKSFELSLDQIMSLYAYSKRDQAGDHLKYGGFVFDGLTEIKEKNKAGITITYKLKDATAYNLSEQTLAEIIDKLTPDQKAFVDAMQDYLSSVMGEKGNEVSLELYAVKLFKEKFYFPLKSAPQYLAKAKEQAQGEVKIKNSGFTKETTPNARNPIVLSSFMDVWAGHVNEMSMYHAFTLPLEDFYRVYNYKTPSDQKVETMSVASSLENAHGDASVNYIDQLLKDLNGGARSDPRETVGKAMMSNFKKASVMASLSVVIQQPTAMVRAMALVDAKYFVGKPDGKKHKAAWAEVKKYAPVAVIKEMGYFDTGMGKGSVEWLKGEKTWKDKIDDIASKAPSLADEMTWVAIWNAVKRETLHTHKDLRPNSEEFLQAVGERFTEVITKTQVYDSTLSRSANMRSKSVFMNMVTAFMAEPTTSINMLQDAFRKGKRGKNTLRVMAAVYGSVILNSALVSLVYAMRDDDEDETFLEKYLSRFTTEVIDGVNPITYIPFLKDIWSVAQGFDVERADMSLINDTIDSLQKLTTILGKDTSGMSEDELEEHNKAVNEAVLKIVDSISSLTGIPVKNIRRDINGIINGFNTIKEDMNGRETTAGSLEDNILEDVKDSVPVWGWLPDESKGDKLYDAIINGDKAYVDRLEDSYKTEDAYHSAIRKALRENDPRIKEAAKAWYNGDASEYSDIIEEIADEGHFDIEDIKAAIKSEYNDMKEDTEEDEEDTDKVVSAYAPEHYYMAVIDRDMSTANKIKEDLIETEIANGKSREEAEASIESGFRTSCKNAYISSDISRNEAMDLLVTYGGKDSDEAYWELKKWDYIADNGSDDGYSKYNSFYEAVRTGKNIKSVISEYTSHGVTKQTLATQITKYYKPMYISMSKSERASLKGYLLNAYSLLGYNRADKSKDIDNWLKG